MILSVDFSQEPPIEKLESLIHVDSRGVEWPSPMGGVNYLLTPPIFEDLISELRRLRNTTANRNIRKNIELQHLLLVTFEELYLASIITHDLQSHKADLLLYELAQSIKILMPSVADFESIETIRSPIDYSDKSEEFYTLEEPTLHEAANRFRKLSRVYVKNLIGNTDEIKNEIINDKFMLPPDAVTILVDHRIVLCQDGAFHVEKNPSEIRVYNSEKNEFSLWIREDTHWRKIPSTAVGWKNLDLPNIPKDNQDELSTPIYNSCAQCHGPKYLEMISPTARLRDKNLIVVAESPSKDSKKFLEHRILYYKNNSSESKMLYILLSSENFNPRHDSEYKKNKIAENERPYWKYLVAVFFLVIAIYLRIKKSHLIKYKGCQND